MEMISSDKYIKEKENLTIEQLLEEKYQLEKKINEIEKDITNNVPDIFNGGRDTRLKMYKEYLLKLNELIENK